MSPVHIDELDPQTRAKVLEPIEAGEGGATHTRYFRSMALSESSGQGTMMSTNPTVQHLENQLERLHAQIRLDQIEAGRIISDLRKSFRHGTWVAYSEKLYRRLGIASKTAYRYVAAFEQSQTIGVQLCDAAVKAGLDLDKVAVRENLIEIRKAHPEAEPDEIVKMTNLRLARPKPTPLPGPESFSGAEFIAALTQCRSEFSKLNQITKKVQRGDGDRLEAESIIASLRALAKDANDRADRLTAALKTSQSEAA